LALNMRGPVHVHDAEIEIGEGSEPPRDGPVQ
jgi:hypothetical protein